MAACLKRDSNVGPASSAAGGSKDNALWRDSRTPPDLPLSSLPWAEDSRTCGIQSEASRWKGDKKNATPPSAAPPSKADVDVGDVGGVNGGVDGQEAQSTNGPAPTIREKLASSSVPPASKSQINSPQNMATNGAEGVREVGHPEPSPNVREAVETRNQSADGESPKADTPKEPTLGSSLEMEPSASSRPTASEVRLITGQASHEASPVSTRAEDTRATTANPSSRSDWSPLKPSTTTKATPPTRSATQAPTPGSAKSPAKSTVDAAVAAVVSEKIRIHPPGGQENQENTRPAKTATSSIHASAAPPNRSPDPQSSGSKEPSTAVGAALSSATPPHAAMPLPRPTSDPSEAPHSADTPATGTSSEASQVSSKAQQDTLILRAPSGTGTQPKEAGSIPSTEPLSAVAPSAPSDSPVAPLAESHPAEKEVAAKPATLGQAKATVKPSQSQRKHGTGAGTGNGTKKKGAGGSGKGGGGGDAVADADAVAGAGADADTSKRKPERTISSSGRSRKRRKSETIRPLAAPMPEPGLEIPEVSEADVGKMVLSETGRGTLTGVIEKFVERDGLGVWSIRYENGRLEDLDDCGELHDDMCAYYEFAGSVAAAEGKLVRTHGNHSILEQIRTRLFEEETKVLGRRVSKVVGKALREGQVTKYIHPKRDGEIDLWRVTWDNGEKEDLESFELIRPLLRYVERRIEQREVPWGFRKLSAYVCRTGNNARPFATLSGISASMYPGP